MIRINKKSAQFYSKEAELGERGQKVKFELTFEEYEELKKLMEDSSNGKYQGDKLGLLLALEKLILSEEDAQRVREYVGIESDEDLVLLDETFMEVAVDIMAIVAKKNIQLGNKVGLNMNGVR